MQEAWILLKERELVRLRVIKRALLGLPAHTAADMLKLSTREVFRLKARVRARGDSGIVHDNCGRQPANALPVSLRQRVLQLHRAKFSRCNDCHFVEALAEEYQIKPDLRSAAIAGTTVAVQQWFDGTIDIRHDRAGEIQHLRLPDRPKPRRPSARSCYDTFAVV